MDSFFSLPVGIRRGDARSTVKARMDGSGLYPL